MKVFILAPMCRQSGGAELAHQMCNAINELTNVPAKMCYVDCGAPFDKALCVDADAPVAYEIYKTSHTTDFSELDTEDSIVVFPEALTLSMPYVKKARKALWWMSVDNYIDSTHENNFGFIKENVDLHLFQSVYAQNYVESKAPQARGMYLSDYINEAHGKFLYPAELRQNIALYNPAKGYEEIKPFIESQNWLKWIPLKGLDVPRMVLIMQSSKVYVDFGEHPGKDRIPREAAANGCCVITNKKGAAANDEDVPIPGKYKFKCPSQEMNDVGKLLHEICDNFKEHQEEFESYRIMIHGEKEKFEKDVKAFVKYFS
ncbi:hypothetical protein [Butyrivibrio sp. YAB3001]|uniref:hypothetical protein n=1 Tax=Butyrivibrio sp. YAB3001 TaxID=1520812 RepID=UPI0008F66571|nr:hypothetical protein [Butyrivibrio sp. YAB3001]SFB94815.1 hypothetical protein SAMN02910398_01107 [Butyrivibrio sp. YAB3001]